MAKAGYKLEEIDCGYDRCGRGYGHCDHDGRGYVRCGHGRGRCDCGRCDLGVSRGCGYYDHVRHGRGYERHGCAYYGYAQHDYAQHDYEHRDYYEQHGYVRCDRCGHEQHVHHGHDKRDHDGFP